MNGFRFRKINVRLARSGGFERPHALADKGAHLFDGNKVAVPPEKSMADGPPGQEAEHGRLNRSKMR